MEQKRREVWCGVLWKMYRREEVWCGVEYCGSEEKRREEKRGVVWCGEGLGLCAFVGRVLVCVLRGVYEGKEKKEDWDGRWEQISV